MKYLLTYLIICTLILAVVPLQAQDSTRQENSPSRLPMDKIFFGGYFGLTFGTVTNIELSPQVGYHITPRFDAGLGISYRYYNDSRYKFSTQMYGGNVFTRLFVFQNLFAYAEVEQINLEVLNLQYEYERKWVNSVFVGGGYQQKMGERFAVNLMILWNVNETRYSPYTNPIIRMGFNF